MKTFGILFISLQGARRRTYGGRTSYLAFTWFLPITRIPIEMHEETGIAPSIPVGRPNGNVNKS